MEVWAMSFSLRVLLISCFIQCLSLSTVSALSFHQLTDSPAIDRHPSWTPDGQYIVFESNRDGNFDLFRVPSAGGVAERLTDAPEDERFPEVSPDGTRIAFSRLSFNSYGQMVGNIYVMPISGGGPWTQVSTSTYSGDFDWHAAWSRDGSTIYFSRRKATDYWDWVVMQAPAAGGATTVYYDARGVQNRPIPSWDGSKVALESNEAGGALNIYETTITTPHRKRQLTFESVNTGAMGYSPDGQTMVYSSRKGRGWFDLYLLDLNTLTSSQLTFDAVSGAYDPNNADAVYSPDGTKIAFTSRREAGNDNIWVIDLGLVATKEIRIDVDPDRCPNEVPRSYRGVLQVAIPGSAEFDPSLVDPASIRLQGSLVPQSWNLVDVTSPAPGPCACAEQGSDGFADLVFDFSQWKVSSAVDLSGDKTITLDITGFLLDGTPVHGSDCLTIVPHAGESPPMATAILSVAHTATGLTSINYSVGEPGRVVVTAYDLSGRKIATVVDLEQPAGQFTATWRPDQAPAGVYFCKLVAGQAEDVRKFIFLH
jgi:Tol biopolymer transport system component